MTRDATRLVREAEGDFLFEHSVRVYQWAALAGRRKGPIFDPELLYVAALFHDFGLTDRYGQSHHSLEADGATPHVDFLRGHGVPEVSRENIWLCDRAPHDEWHFRQPSRPAAPVAEEPIWI